MCGLVRLAKSLRSASPRDFLIDLKLPRSVSPQHRNGTGRDPKQGVYLRSQATLCLADSQQVAAWFVAGRTDEGEMTVTHFVEKGSAGPRGRANGGPMG